MRDNEGRGLFHNPAEWAKPIKHKRENMVLVADAPPPAYEVEQIGWSVKRRGNVFKTAL